MQAKRQISLATMDAALSTLQAQREHRQLSRSQWGGSSQYGGSQYGGRGGISGPGTPMTTATGSPEGSVVGGGGGWGGGAWGGGMHAAGGGAMMTSAWPPTSVLASAGGLTAAAASSIAQHQPWGKSSMQQRLPDGSLLSLPSVPHSHAPSVSSVQTPSISSTSFSRPGSTEY